MHAGTLRAALALSAAAILACAAPARADAVTWTNPAGGNWTDATWSPHSPNGGDDVVNPLAAANIQFATTININTLLSQGGLDITSGQLGGSQAAAATTIQVNNTLLVDGGGLANLTVVQGTGGVFQYSGNGGNYFSGVIINANVTPGAGGFVELFNANTLNATWNLANTSNGIRFHDGNAALTISATGNLRGFGATFNFFNGGTLINNGLVSADTSGQTLTLGNSNITGSGTFSASNGGTLSIGGLINGSNATVSVDANPASAVLIDGGGISGTFIAASGTGFSFSGNGANYMSNAAINGNVTLNGGAFVEIFNGLNSIGGTLNMAGTSNGIRFHDGNAGLTITGTMRGYGATFNFFTGGTLTNNGLVSADVSGQSLTLNNSNITGSGTFQGIGGGTLAIGGVLNGLNATIHADTGTVLIDGGTVTGTFIASTGAGISFSGNGANNMNNAAIAGNATVAGGGFVEIFNGLNSIGGTLNMAGTSNGIRFHDGNAELTITSTGTMRGYGVAYNFFNGGTLANNGLVSADVNAQTLALDNSNITGSGTFQGINGGTLAIGGLITGSGATVHADTGAVLIDGGTVTGTFVASTGAGISFSGNGANALSNALIAGNATVAGGGFVEIFNGLNSIGGTLNMAGSSNGIRFHDGNAVLTITGTMRGYGATFNFFNGGTLANNGLISADVSGQTLTLGQSNTAGTGIYQGIGGGTLAISSALVGTNATIHGDTGTVLVDNGTVAGTFAAATGSGFSFSGNGGNALTGADINGNLTVAGGGYVQIFNPNTVRGTINMAGTSNGIQFHDGNASLTLSSTGTLRGYGATFDFFGGGQLINHGTIAADTAGQTLALNHTATLSDGHITVATSSTLSVGGTLSQSGGETSVDGTLSLANNFSITGGVLDGVGTINGNILNSAGIASPGHSPGLLTINGNYEQDVAAALDIQLAGYTPGVSYDQLDTTTSLIAGTLDVSQINGFVPIVGDTFDILTYTSHAGTFTTLASDTGLTYHVDYLSDRARITIDAVTQVPEPGTLSLAFLALPLLARRKRCRS